jgi:hypothetical protein
MPRTDVRWLTAHSGISLPVLKYSTCFTVIVQSVLYQLQCSFRRATRGIIMGTRMHISLNIYTVPVKRRSRKNVPDFGRVFLMLKYTDITQNTYIQGWTVKEIMAREKFSLLAGPRSVPVSWQSYLCPSLSVVSYYDNSVHGSHKLHMYFLQSDNIVHVVTSVMGSHVSCILLGTLRTTMTWVRVFL